MPAQTLPALPDLAVLGRVVARNLGVPAAELAGSLRPAAAADLQSVLAFRRDHLHVPIRWDDPAYLRWRYRFGDPGAGFGEMMVLWRHGEPVALLGLETLRCRHAGSEFTGVRGMDLLVRPDLHESGLGTWLNRWMIEHHGFVLAMGANANSIGIVRRLFRPLPARLTYTHPIDLRPFVARRWPRWGAASAPLWPVVNMALQWRHAVRARPAAGAAAELVPLARFADPLPAPDDAGGERVVVQNGAGHLNRRLLDNPRRPCRALALRRGGRAVGHVAWAEGADAGGHPELHVVDWSAASAQDLGVAFDAVVREARARRCSCVRVVLQDAAEQEVALRTGFLASADEEGRIAGVQSRDEALAARLAAARWALTDLTDDADGF